jgi:DNA-binding transcriptional MocR family regulator
VLASSGSANHFASSAILLPLLRSGLFDQHVNRLRSTLQHRCRALCQALRLYLPQTVQFSEPSGGYFVWLTLPVGASSLQFRDQCMREEHVAFAPGTWFFLTPDEESDRCMRLCFAFYDESVLMASAAKLGRCLHSYLASIQTGSPVLKGDLII